MNDYAIISGSFGLERAMQGMAVPGSRMKLTDSIDVVEI